jgi:hypothetical protein
MVHVEYHADGWEREQTHERDFADGSDRKRETAFITREVEVDAEIRLPGGHVNLEAYAPDVDPDGVAETLQYHLTPDDIEVDTGSIEANIHGNSDEWITQARRYISERPSMDVFDALEKFRKWDCTNSGTIDTAMQRAADDDTIMLTPLSGAEA